MLSAEKGEQGGGVSGGNGEVLVEMLVGGLKNENRGRQP